MDMTSTLQHEAPGRMPLGWGEKVVNPLVVLKREERHQEFRLQDEMQRQQMQNQQNMMAMIMMSMMGRNASGSVPNDGVVNMFPGICSTEQRNDREGSNSNTQE